MQSITATSSFISHLALHVPAIHQTTKKIDVEPVLIAYFSSYTRTNISKDALSKVTKTFFKELKMHYRKLGSSFTQVLCSLTNFFVGHESITVASFW